MADRLYTSSEADEILSALRFETKLEKVTLARMAFALSVAQIGKDVPSSPNFSGGEMKRPTFLLMIKRLYGRFYHTLTKSLISAKMNCFPIALSQRTTSTTEHLC
ncbi:DNA sulfur modification protein DndE [Jannaschia seosinensis]|uniref:DNA sulfur modification protein DndE n=1 Tax=Jannaschia seosinensis TaxID=313367 RepID=A0A0M7BDR1_9RHOB|nr:DndE family protein [Jannaschia seosinensis]CUH40208.1 DNA sulfur modification protein DndE [Jannaschia seosinensis]